MTVAAESAGFSMRWMGKREKALREKDDFYPTPPDAIDPLLAVERFEGPVWEPACGRGDISERLIAHGYEVVSTDLIDRGYGQGRIDFLMEQRALAPNIVTNPPFKLGEEFARKALALGAAKIAFLCRLQWLEGKSRADLFRQSPLARVWVFASRRTMARADEGPATHRGMIPYAWFVWERGHTGAPTLGWLCDRARGSTSM